MLSFNPAKERDEEIYEEAISEFLRINPPPKNMNSDEWKRYQQKQDEYVQKRVKELVETDGL